MNFQKKLTIRFILSVIYIAFGAAVMIAVGAENEEIFPLGSIFLALGIIKLIKSIRLKNNAAAFEEQKIKEEDERNILIYEKSRALAYSICIALAGLAVLIMLISGKGKEYAAFISYGICIATFVYAMCYYILRNKM